MLNFVLCRGGMVVGRQSGADPPPSIVRVHLRPRDPSEPISLSSLSTEEAFAEVFVLNEKFRCPCCDSVTYNSKNYMEAPWWLRLT